MTFALSIPNIAISLTCDQLIDALRAEIQEYGQLFSLFDEQQHSILGLRNENASFLQKRINKTEDAVRRLRNCSRLKANAIREGARLTTRAGRVALREEYVYFLRPLLDALIREVNRLLVQTKLRKRQIKRLSMRHPSVVEIDT